MGVSSTIRETVCGEEGCEEFQSCLQRSEGVSSLLVQIVLVHYQSHVQIEKDP